MKKPASWLMKQLELQEKKQAEIDAQSKPPFLCFDEYLKLHPEAESWRASMSFGALLVACYSSCLPGDYYIVKAIPDYDWRAEPPRFLTSGRMVVNDGDDGYYEKAIQMDEANIELEKLKLLAPFHGSDLVKFFGYNYG